MDIIVCLNGLYPRSETLVQATRDYDRGRISQAVLHEVYTQDYEALRNLQKNALWVNDGMLIWQDLVRPFAELGNARLGPLTRYFETNTFFRYLIFPDTPSFQVKPEWFDHYFRFGNHAILPSPLTLTQMTTLNLQQVTHLLTMVVEGLVERGIEGITWMEGFAPYAADPRLLAETLPAWDALRRTAPSTRMILQLYFGSAIPFQDTLERFPVDGIGIDLTYTDIASFRLPHGKGLVLGIVDTTNSLQETWQTVQEAVERAIDKTPPFLGLTGSADFHFLPRDVADQKYAFLQTIREKIG